jgi:hypothetical protein
MHRLRLLLAMVTAGTACARATPPASPNAVHIVGTDYAFAAPDSLPAGATVLTFENRGKQRHEMLVARLKDGVSPRQFADSLMSGVSVRPLRATGSAVLFADAGQRNEVVSLRVDLTRGERWAIWCQFADSTGAPKHQTLGMFKLVTVQ